MIFDALWEYNIIIIPLNFNFYDKLVLYKKNMMKKPQSLNLLSKYNNIIFIALG